LCLAGALEWLDAPLAVVVVARAGAVEAITQHTTHSAKSAAQTAAPSRCRRMAMDARRAKATRLYRTDRRAT
jgi:hypothetical protein